MYPDPKRPRSFGLLDAVIVIAVVAALAYSSSNVSSVLVYRWDWGFLPQVLIAQTEDGGWRANLLLEGFLTTIRLSLWAMLLALAVGTMLGLLSTQKRLLARLIALSYVGLIRNIPPLVFVFIFFFFISSQITPAIGLDSWARDLSPTAKSWFAALLGPSTLLENLISGVICLALFEAAYIAEIVRAGIQSIPDEQTEAGESLGLKPRQVFRLIILPQALRAVTPPLANQFILLVKNSAIVSLISVQELTFIGTEVAVSTGRRFETWLVVAAMYFVLCFGLALMFKRWERRVAARTSH